MSGELEQMSSINLAEDLFAAMREQPVEYLKRFAAQRRDEHRQKLEGCIVNSPEMHYERVMHESFSLMILHLEGRIPA